MDGVVSQIQDLFEGRIDFHGQRLADIISTSVLSITSIFALIIGLIKEDIHLSMWIVLAGTAVTLLIVVPPWPFFNQHPQAWLGTKTALPPGGIVISGQKVQ